MICKKIQATVVSKKMPTFIICVNIIYRPMCPTVHRYHKRRHDDETNPLAILLAYREAGYGTMAHLTW